MKTLALRFIGDVVIGPIERGRLSSSGWPTGLAPVVYTAVGAFILSVALVLGAPLLRAVLPLSVTSGSNVLSMPRPLLPVFFGLVVLSLALVQTAAMHIAWRAAVPITLFTTLAVLFIGGLDRGASFEGVELTPGKIAASVSVIVIIGLLIARRTRAFSWLEFAVVFVAISVTTVISLDRSAASSVPFGIDFAPPTASLIMSSLGSLAVPAAVAAGVAVAELAINIARAVSRLASAVPKARRTNAPLFALLAVALIVIGDSALRLPSMVVSEVIGAASLTVAIAGAWMLVHRLQGQRVNRAGPPLTDSLNAVLLPVAGALTFLLAPVVVVLLAAQILFSWGAGMEWSSGAFLLTGIASSTAATTVVRIIAGIAFFTIGIVLARRGRQGIPELLVAFGIMIVTLTVPELYGQRFGWSSDALALVVGAASIIAALAFALTRTLSRHRQLALITTLVLSEAIAWRDVLADPLGALLGASAVAFILFGFVWGFLTGAEPTKESSAAYPQASRVLLFLANSLFGATVLAFAALARNLDVVIDLDKFAQVGDAILGTALLVVVVVATGATLVNREDSTLSARGLNSPTGGRTVEGTTDEVGAFHDDTNNSPPHRT